MPAREPKDPNLQSARRNPNRRADSFVGNIRQSILVRFGAALKERRRSCGLTQAELAQKSGLNRSYISEVECGRENISLERAERLAVALDCALADLLKERYEPTTDSERE